MKFINNTYWCTKKQQGKSAGKSVRNIDFRYSDTWNNITPQRNIQFSDLNKCLMTQYWLRKMEIIKKKKNDNGLVFKKWKFYFSCYKMINDMGKFSRRQHTIY